MVVENMVTATALALPPHTKKVLAPAMNTKMFENPLTQHNLERLQRFGWKIIQPREAVLACGDQGIGALAEIDTIYFITYIYYISIHLYTIFFLFFCQVFYCFLLF